MAESGYPIVREEESTFTPRRGQPRPSSDGQRHGLRSTKASRIGEILFPRIRDGKATAYPRSTSLASGGLACRAEDGRTLRSRLDAKTHAPSKFVRGNLIPR